MYKDLSEFLSIPEEYTHIGMFGEKTMGDGYVWCDPDMSYGRLK